MIKASYARFSIFLAIAFGLFLLVVCAQASKNNGQEFTLTILHSNDLHAHDQSFIERGTSVGGMARIAHIIQSVKQKCSNVVVVDAGDFFQGTPFFQEYGGQTEISLLNQAGYDIVTLGNHEFDNGPDKLAKQLVAAKFAIISCNLDFSLVPDLQKLVVPSLVKTVGGERVAFIGCVTPDLQKVALNSAPVKVKALGDDWMQPIKTEVERYRAEGINKIVLVSHCGVDIDKQLAQSITDIDVIIGGHSHTRLNEPIWAVHADGTKTAIVQTGSYGRALGKLDLAFDQQGQLIELDTHYHLININDRIKDDQAVLDYINKKASPLLALRREIVGFAEGEFDNKFANLPWDSPIGDLIADALAEEGSSYGATISFQNRGGIRARIERGPVTEEKIRELLPFENHLVLGTIDGEHLLSILEHSVAFGLGGSFLDVHGIKFAYDPSKPVGQRVIFALAQDETGKWSPIRAESTYRFAVNDYTFKGGEGYEFSQAQDVVRLSELLSEAFHKYLIRHKSIRPDWPNRIVPLTNGLAELLEKPQQELVIHLPNAAAKVTVLYGDDLGVEPFSKLTKTFPVPIAGLSSPKCLYAKRIVQNQSSELVMALSQLKGCSQSSYLVVICQAKNNSGSQLKVSYPLPTKDLAAMK